MNHPFDTVDGHLSGEAHGSTELQMRRVRKAYEQVVDQLREMLVDGRISVGDRLPTEAVLAREFGVSRPTVREALRVLSAQSLIETVKGSAGGSYVTLPSLADVSELVHTNIALMADVHDLSLDEFLEARELVEVPAARLAALRRSEADLKLLREAVAGEGLTRSTAERFAVNREFHATLVDCSGNRLLRIAAHPIYSVLQLHLSRSLSNSTLGDDFHATIDQQHGVMTEMIAAGDADAVEAEMRAHLEFLRPAYERAWPQPGRRDA